MSFMSRLGVKLAAPAATRSTVVAPAAAPVLKAAPALAPVIVAAPAKPPRGPKNTRVPIRAKRKRRASATAPLNIYEAHVGMIYSTALKIVRHNDPRLPDLIQEGCVGLMRATQKYDATMGTTFNTYAVYWVRAYMMRWMTEHRSLVSRHHTGANASRALPFDLSLDTPAIGEDGDSSEEAWVEKIAGEWRLPDDEANTNLLSARVSAKLERIRARLGPVGWDIVQNRLMKQAEGRGRDADQLEVIGSRHGVSRERVRQVELKVKVLLKRWLAEYNQNEEGAQNDNQGL